MSALGQKQTCAVQKGMSALPPIATTKANIGAQSKTRDRMADEVGGPGDFERCETVE